MKSIVITLASAALLSAGVLAAGQSLNAASAGAILFAASVVSFAFADYSRRPRLALRPVTSPAPHAVRPVTATARVTDYSATVAFNTIAA